MWNSLPKLTTIAFVFVHKMLNMRQIFIKATYGKKKTKHDGICCTALHFPPPCNVCDGDSSPSLQGILTYSHDTNTIPKVFNGICNKTRTTNNMKEKKKKIDILSGRIWLCTLYFETNVHVCVLFSWVEITPFGICLCLRERARS